MRSKDQFPIGRTVKLLEGTMMNLKMFLRHNDLIGLRAEIIEARYRIELFCIAEKSYDKNSIINYHMAKAGRRYVTELHSMLQSSTGVLRSSFRLC